VTLAVELDGPLAWLGSLMAGKLTREYIEQEADALKRSAEALRAADDA
jgi:hypothetical protein